MPEQSRAKLAVITGASRGLGKAIATVLCDKGYRVALGARSKTELDALRDSLQESGHSVVSHPLDVASSDSITAFRDFIVSNCGQPDVLINNAGLGYMKPLAKLSVEEIATTFNVNVIGTMLTTKAFLDDLKATKGYIINIASDVGRRPVGGISVYAAAKHAVVGFSNSLLREIKQDGVRVSVANPGSIQTNFNDTTSPGAALDPKAMSAIDAAKTIALVLDTPPGVVIDEIQFHPMQQDF